MITIVDSPKGHLLDRPVNTGTSKNSGGDVAFYSPLHGMANDNSIFIENGPLEYLGFWYITVTDANDFKIRRTLTDPYEPFISQDQVITYYRVLVAYSELAGTDTGFVLDLHGLINDEVIYITEGPIEFLGFWYVTVLDSSIFKVRRSLNDPYLTYYREDIKISFYKTLGTCDWHALGLPIVYKLRNDMHPVNTLDTSAVISSFTNDNGMVRLVLSNSIHDSVYPNDRILLMASDESIYGVYTVVNRTSDSQFTINLVYRADYTIGGNEVRFEYNNYHNQVRVYGGMPDPGLWTAQYGGPKLLATLKLVPDENNEVLFSVSDVLRVLTETVNRPNTIPYPNEFSVWTSFYIAIEESYDKADSSGNIEQIHSGFVNETDRHFGINAVLPFKNIHSGAMSDYVGDERKFLSAMRMPVIFKDRYRDVSFIWDKLVGTTLRRRFYTNDVLTATVDTEIQGVDRGVYRVDLDVKTCDDRVDVSVVEVKQVSDLNQWRIQVESTPIDVTWTEGTLPYVDFASSGFSKYLLVPYTVLTGESVSMNIEISKTDGNPTSPINLLYLALFKEDLTKVGEVSTGVSGGAGVYNNTLTVTATGNAAYIAIRVYNPAGTNPKRIGFLSNEIISGPLSDTSEVKSFAINCDCEWHDIYLGWLNHLGGWEYWNFTSGKDHQIEIGGALTVRKNLLPNWPRSYGEFAQTIDKNINRTSKRQLIVRSQNLTKQQVEDISLIKTSALVQIIDSRYDSRTVLVDTQSFKVYGDVDKQYTLSFTITFTDNIPSQTV